MLGRNGLGTDRLLVDLMAEIKETECHVVFQEVVMKGFQVGGGGRHCKIAIGAQELSIQFVDYVLLSESQHFTGMDTQ